MDKYYSTQEAAKLLGVTRVTVFRQIKNGKIKAEKVGRNFVIPASEISSSGKHEKTSGITHDEIDRAVKLAVKDYGRTLKRLGAE